MSNLSNTSATMPDIVPHATIVTDDETLTRSFAIPTDDSLEAIQQRVAFRAAAMKIKFDWNELKHDRDAGRP